MLNGDTKSLYIGIDVQINRGPCYATFNENGLLVDSGWLGNNHPDLNTLLELKETLQSSTSGKAGGLKL